MGLIPRIAHLEDKLEKKDKVIAKLKKDNLALKVSYSCYHKNCNLQDHPTVFSIGIINIIFVGTAD